MTPFLVLGDVLACVAAGLLTEGSWTDVVVLTVVLAAAFGVRGLYRSRLNLSVLDDLPSVLLGWVVAVAAVLVYHYLLLDWIGGVRVLGAALALVVVVRAMGYYVVREVRRRGAVAHESVILGVDDTAEELANRLIDSPEYGLRPIGFVDAYHGDEARLPVPMLGTADELPLVLKRNNPKVLFVSRGALTEPQLVALLRDCHRQRCEVFVVPRLSEIHRQSQETEFVWGIPVVRLRRSAYRSGAWRIKRVSDLSLASVAVLLFSPILLACAVAVRVADGPGVIFRQERVGVDGRRFQVLKFRSLKPVDETESQQKWNIAHDDRLGPVGKFLRRSSLDELPQLFNILKGEMSIVGPRPERPHFVAEFGQLYTGYYARHRVPCGLTGWAQIHGLRGDTPIADRARFDNWYIENWSLWLDFKIVLRTAVSVFKAPGA